MGNPYCDALGIDVPSLDSIRDHPDASPYTWMIIVLLEHGRPMTLEDIAERMEAAGLEDALTSLKRARPARAPVFRDGDLYGLDPYDDELDLWLFRLGLRAASAPMLRVVRPPYQRPDPESPLTIAELDLAFREASLWSWSPQRLALSVLDAHRRPMRPEEVIAFLRARMGREPLRGAAEGFRQSQSAVRVLPDGRWATVAGHPWLRAARKAVRDRVEAEHRRRADQPDAAEIEAAGRARARRNERQRAELAKLRRVIVHAAPAAAPEGLVLLDVNARTIETRVGAELRSVGDALAGYDVIAALDVRPLLRALGFDPGMRRLAELGPSQKTFTLQSRRQVPLTIDMLLRGSCDISLRLESGRAKKRSLARLADEAKALYALYEYGRLHGTLLVRHGRIEADIRAPWAYPNDGRLWDLMQRALETGEQLDLVAGTAPSWDEPWAGAQRFQVVQQGYQTFLVDMHGTYAIAREAVQRARLASGAR